MELKHGLKDLKHAVETWAKRLKKHAVETWAIRLKTWS